jgi:hypothetical protein
MKTSHSNAELMFSNPDEALSWSEALDEKGLKYLHDVDSLIAKFQKGQSINLNNIVLPKNLQRFLRCISYVLIACNLVSEFGFNDDFTVIKRYES